MFWDIMDVQCCQCFYVVIFCGVNGVGKFINFVKIFFWLLENGFSVFIVVCDIFCVGVVEQLCIYIWCLSVLYFLEKYGGCIMVQLFEKGYGKDVVGIVMEVIVFVCN